MSRMPYVPRRLSCDEGEPFAGAEDAWLWYSKCQLARLAGGRLRADMAAQVRPCDPDDIHREVMRLYRRGVLSSPHMRVLAELGCRLATNVAPEPWSRGQDILWREALDRLETPLRAKGLVA